MSGNETLSGGPPTELLPSFRPCYFCGTGNTSGFKIRYSYAPGPGRVTGKVWPDVNCCSYPGVLHGGLQSAFLDDIMYWAVSYRTATSAVTVELSCRFRKTAELGQRLTLEARCGQPQGRKVRTEGALRDEAGGVLAEASALYLLHPREEFVATQLPLLDFEGCTEAMVEHFTRGGSEGRPRP